MKSYMFRFGSGNPNTYTGLTPTFTIFNVMPGTSAIAAPTITEAPSGTGLYVFQYNPTLPISFMLDGGSSLNSGIRYITGTLDPIQAVDQGLGFNTDSYGSTSIDPTTLFGYLRRALEFMEGDNFFNKTTGIWSIFNRASLGTTTLLRNKTIANASGSVTKSGL